MKYFRFQLLEFFVILSFVVYSTTLSINEVRFWRNRSDHGVTIVNPSSRSIEPAVTLEIKTNSDGNRFFHEPAGYGKWDNFIDSIAVYSSPLEAPFASSTSSIRSYFQRQFFSVDYHAFIVLRTNYGRWWAVDKMRDGIFVSYGESEDSVVFYFDQKPRPRPLRLLIDDKTDSSGERLFFSTIFNRIKNRSYMSSHEYDIVTENCQHFCKDLFDKFASSKWWKFPTLVDLTSPLLIFTNASKSNILRVLASFCEICFFLAEPRFGVLNFSQLPTIKHVFIALVLFIAMFSVTTFEVTKGLLSSFGRTVCIFMFIESIFCRPFKAVKRRTTQYRKIWKSGRDILKGLLPLVYTLVYGEFIMRRFVEITFITGDAVLHMIGASPSASFPVRESIVDLFHTIGEDNVLIIIYVFVFMYFAFSTKSNCKQ